MILVAPIDARSLAPTLDQAASAGIPVLSIDAAVEGAVCISHCASDNVAGGRLAAEIMLADFAKKGLRAGYVLILDHFGVTSTYLRVKGFRDVMQEKGPYYVCVVADAEGNLETAMEKTARTLKSVGHELVGVFASNGRMSLGALKTLEEKGLSGTATVIGFDDVPELRQAVDSGSLSGLVIQKPKAIAAQAFTIAHNYLTGANTTPPPQSLVPVGTYPEEKGVR